jgi:DNA-binding winged helix-turn-helix (wHTH) protein/tetratricopeptide (TPR) repeat protein
VAAAARRGRRARALQGGSGLSAAEAFRFGPFRLDRGRRVLWRGDALVEVAPRALDVLVALAERAGEVVTKDELMQRVWPDTFVEEANLSVNVSALRKALGTGKGGHAYIQTIPRRGYRFVSPPEDGAPTAAPRPSIAVLPFRDLSPGAGDEYLGVGTSVALISRLSRLSGIVVRPTSAILKYVDAPADPRDAGRDLRVDAVVEGTVQRSGTRVRATVHLVRVAEDGAVWSGAFEEEMTSLFAVQDAAAEQIARALDVELRGADRAVLARRDTADVLASQAYLKGRYFWSRFTGEWMGRAFACFQEAVERDPRYALPHAGLADAYLVLGFSGLLPPREAWSLAEESARTALGLDESLADAHIALGYVRLFRDWDWESARASLKRALDLSPGAAAHQWYGLLLAMEGRLDEARQEIERAVELEPLSVMTSALRGFQLNLAGDHARELVQARATVELDPNHFLSHWSLGLACEHVGRMEDSATAIRRAADLAGDNPIVTAVLARAEALAGRRDEARGILDSMESDRSVRPSEYQRAAAELALGEREEALRRLESAAAACEPWMVLLKVDPMLTALRGDPRFDALVKRVFAE